MLRKNFLLKIIKNYKNKKKNNKNLKKKIFPADFDNGLLFSPSYC